MNIGDLVLENFEGVGVVMTNPYKYYAKWRPAPNLLDDVDYNVVMVRFAHDTFEMDCDELKVISECR